VSPALTSAEINSDDTVPAFRTRVRDEREPTHAVVAIESEADIVKVRVPVADCRRESDGPKDSVIAQIHAHKLAAASVVEKHARLGVCRAAGVEEPETVETVDNDGLHADEVVGEICSCGLRSGGSVDGTTWR
jgi:hypothetical protein